jgi:hypothetical protein
MAVQAGDRAHTPRAGSTGSSLRSSSGSPDSKNGLACITVFDAGVERAELTVLNQLGHDLAIDFLELGNKDVML